MAVSIRSVSTTVNNATIALPAGYDSASDFLVFFIGTTNATITPPTNVTLITGISGGFSGWTEHTYTANVALAGNQTFTTGGSYTDIWCICCQGADLTAVPTQAGGTASTNDGTGTTSTGLALTVPSGRDGSLLLHNAISSSGARSSGPVGMNAASGSPTDTNYYVDYLEVNAGSTGNKTSTYSSQDWTIQMVLIQPPASSAAFQNDGSRVSPSNQFAGNFKINAGPESEIDFRFSERRLRDPRRRRPPLFDRALALR